MGSFDKSPIASKINWAAALQIAINGIAYALDQDAVKNNIGWVFALNAISGVLILVLRTFFTSKPTTITLLSAFGVLFALASAAVGSPAFVQAAVVDVVSVAGQSANYKLPLAPHKPAVVSPKSASACGPNGCGPVSRGGVVKAFFGRLLGR